MSAAPPHRDLALVDVNPAAPPPRLGSSVSFSPLPEDGAGWSVTAIQGDGTTAATVLGRLPPEAGPLASSSAATVRSVRRADGVLAALVVRVTEGGGTAAPADDSDVSPVPRRRGKGEHTENWSLARKEAIENTMTQNVASSLPPPPPTQAWLRPRRTWTRTTCAAA